MKNRFNKGFEETKQNKVPKYGIRKLKVGVVSCLLAFSMFAPAVGAHAEVKKYEGKPVHSNTDPKKKADADRLYDSVNKDLKDIADHIAEELEGIQQLEANIAEAMTKADTAEKAEKDAKEDLAKKKADYKAKKELYKKATDNFNQRDTEKKAAEKAQGRANTKYENAKAKLKLAKSNLKDYAGQGSSEQDRKNAEDAWGEVEKKKTALQQAQADRVLYEKYKDIKKAEDLKDDDTLVEKEAKKDKTVDAAVGAAKGKIKYEDTSTNDAIKNAIQNFKNDVAKHSGKKAALKLANDGVHAELNTDASVTTAECKDYQDLKDDIIAINKAIDDEKEKITKTCDIKEIKEAREKVIPNAKKKVYNDVISKLPKDDTKVNAAQEELDKADKKAEEMQNIVDAKDTKKDSAAKKVEKAEQKADEAQEALDQANNTLETANDNYNAAFERRELAKAEKKAAEDAQESAHIALFGDGTEAHPGAHELFRRAKEDLRATRKASQKGDSNLPTHAEKRGIDGLRKDVADELTKAEDEYSKVEEVVKSRENKIKMYKDLIESTKKFAAMAGDTDASESFDATIDKYYDKIEEYADQVADYKEKLAESTALMTIIRQLAEKAKVLKPRNLKPEGWNKEGNDWTYTDSSGMTVKDNWVQGKNGDWFYLDGFGKMAHDKWVEVNKKWFYAGSNGVIAQEQWIQNKLGDWFYVKKGGYMAQNEWVQVKGQWYYAQKDGNMAKNVTLNVNGVNYSFNANCAWVK